MTFVIVHINKNPALKHNLTQQYVCFTSCLDTKNMVKRHELDKRGESMGESRDHV